MDFISTHAPRTGSDVHRQTDTPPEQMISTHAPRTGSDSGAAPSCAAARNFNPRSPHGERRGERGAGSRRHDFNPRSPHGERRNPVRRLARSMCNFNPRSPHGERQRWRTYFTLPTGFQPTLPARGATIYHGSNRIARTISTHAPRTGSDFVGCANNSQRLISTHAPRTGSDSAVKRWKRFSPISTHAPRTGSDVLVTPEITGTPISTHAPRTGSDKYNERHAIDFTEFQPTLPARGATLADAFDVRLR